MAQQYKDLSDTFDIHPIKKDLIVLTDSAAVKAAIKNLVLTQHYERPFQPDIGTSVYKLLFENFTPIIGTLIEREITDVIRNYEPRAAVDRVIVKADPDNHDLEVTISFYLKTTNEYVEFDFLLERVR